MLSEPHILSIDHIFKTILEKCKDDIFKHVHLISRNTVVYHFKQAITGAHSCKYPREQVKKYSQIYNVEWMLNNGYIGLLLDKFKSDTERSRLEFNDKSFLAVCKNVKDLQLFKEIYQMHRIHFQNILSLETVVAYNTFEVFQYFIDHCHDSFKLFESTPESIELNVTIMTNAVKNYNWGVINYMLEKSDGHIGRIYNQLDLLTARNDEEINGSEITKIFNFVSERTKDLSFVISGDYQLVFQTSLANAKRFLHFNKLEPVEVERYFLYLHIAVPPVVFNSFPKDHFLDNQLYIIHYLLNDYIGYGDIPVEMIQEIKSKFIKLLDYKVDEDNVANNHSLVLYHFILLDLLWEFKYGLIDGYCLENEIPNIVQRALVAYPQSTDILPHIFEFERRYQFKENVFDLICKHGSMVHVNWASENIQKLNDSIALQAKKERELEKEEKDKQKPLDNLEDYMEDPKKVVKFYHMASHKAMDSAIERGNLEMVKYLLLNRKEQCTLSLQQCVHSKVVDFLLEMKPKLWEHYSCQYALKTLDLEFIKKVYSYYQNNNKKQNLQLSVNNIKDILTKMPTEQDQIAMVQFLLDNFKEDFPFTRFLSQCCRDGNILLFKFTYQYLINSQDKGESVMTKLHIQHLEMFNTTLLDEAFLFGLNNELVDYIITSTQDIDTFSFGSQTVKIVGKFGTAKEFNILLKKLKLITYQDTISVIFENAMVYGNIELLKYINATHSDQIQQFVQQPNLMNCFEKEMLYGSLSSRGAIYILENAKELKNNSVLLNNLFIQSILCNRITLATYLLNSDYKSTITTTTTTTPIINKKLFLQVCWNGYIESVEFIIKNQLMGVDIYQELNKGLVINEIDFQFNPQMNSVYRHLVDVLHIDIAKSPSSTNISVEPKSTIVFHRNPLSITDDLFKKVFGNRYLFTRIFGWRPSKYLNLTRDKLVRKHPSHEYKFKYGELGYPIHSNYTFKHKQNYKLLRLQERLYSLLPPHTMTDSDNPNIMNLAYGKQGHQFSFEPDVFPKFYSLFYGNNSKYTIYEANDRLEHSPKLFSQDADVDTLPAEFTPNLNQDEFIDTEVDQIDDYHTLIHLYHHNQEKFKTKVDSLTSYSCTSYVLEFLQHHLEVSELKKVFNRVGSSMFTSNNGTFINQYQRDFQHLVNINQETLMNTKLPSIYRLLSLEYGIRFDQLELDKIIVGGYNQMEEMLYFYSNVASREYLVDINSTKQLVFLSRYYRVPGFFKLVKEKISSIWKLDSKVLEFLLNEYEKEMVLEDFENHLATWNPNSKLGYKINTLIYTLLQKKGSSPPFISFDNSIPVETARMLYSNNAVSEHKILEWAVSNRDIKMFKLILEKDKVIPETKIFKGSDPIMKEMLLYLFEYGYSSDPSVGMIPSIIGKQGDWELYIQCKSIESIKHKESSRYKDHNQWNANDLKRCLTCAIRSDQLEFIKRLVNSGLKEEIEKILDDIYFSASNETTEYIYSIKPKKEKVEYYDDY